MLHWVVGNPDAVKGIIVRSGVYDHGIDVALDNQQKTVDKFGELPTGDPTVRAIIKQAYSPQVLRVSTEKFIDGTYHWLDGTTTQPDFSLDVRAPNQALIEGIGNYAKARSQKLPACTTQQLEQIKAVNALSAPCLPPGANIDQLVEQAKAKLRDEKLLSYQQVTADTFKGTGESQNFFEGATAAPKVFQTFQNLLWVLLILCAIVAGLIIFLSAARQRGLLRVGKIMTITGAAIVLIGIALYFTKSTVLSDASVKTGPIGKQITIPLLVEFSKAAGRVYLIFGGLVLSAGAVLWLTIHRLLRQHG